MTADLFELMTYFEIFSIERIKEGLSIWSEAEQKRILNYMHNTKGEWMFPHMLTPGITSRGEITYVDVCKFKSAVGKKLQWWIKKAKKYEENCQSRLGTIEEYMMMVSQMRDYMSKHNQLGLIVRDESTKGEYVVVTDNTPFTTVPATPENLKKAVGWIVLQRTNYW